VVVGVKRGVSPLVASLFIIAVSLVAVGIFSTMYNSMLEKYTPHTQVITLAGTPEIDLMQVSAVGGTTYIYQVRIPLINMGDDPITIQSGELVIIVKGTNSAKITRCTINGGVQLYPNEITFLTGTCRLDSIDFTTLFGQANPPADVVKKNIDFLYIRVLPALSTGGGGASGLGGIVLV
jgi:hypothetical protein